MLGVRLSADLEQRLNKLARETHRSKSYYVKLALIEFLEEQEDYLAAAANYEEYLRNSKKSISLEELEKKLGLTNETH